MSSKAKAESSFEKGTLSLVLSWDESAAGRTFQAVVPLHTLKPDGREGAVFSTVEALKLCSPRRDVKVKLLEPAIMGEEDRPLENAEPLVLRFIVEMPPECGAQENRVVAVVGRVAYVDPSVVNQVTGIGCSVKAMEVSCFCLNTAHGEPVACHWEEIVPKRKQ